MSTRAHPQVVTDLKLDGEKALFDKKIKGIVSLCFENERPLQGLAGKLDWKFHGLLSQFIRDGKITGKEGECVYIPARKSNETYHLILVGAGFNDKPGTRKKVTQSVITEIKKNLKSLHIDNIGISCEDFGGVTEKYFLQEFQETPLWIVQ